MAATATPYGQFWVSLGNKEIDLNSDQIKGLITTNSYTPNKDTHRYLSDVTNEITGTNYPAGGVVIGTPTIVWDSANQRFVFDANDVLLSNVTFTGGRRFVIYDNTPSTSATKPLISWTDFGADQSPAGLDFAINWHADGIFKIAA